MTIPETQSRPAYLTLLILFLIALSVRVVYLFELAEFPLFDVILKGLDHHNFDQAAQNFANGDWLALSPNNSFSPLYKYFLGPIYFFFGRNFYVIYSIQFVMGAVASVLVYLIARELFDNRTALIAFAGFAFYTTEIIYEGVILRAAFITFWGLLAFYLCLRLQKRFSMVHLILTALALSVFFQTRPNTLLCLPVVIYFLARWVFVSLPPGERKKSWGIFFATLLLSFVPLLIQCYLVHGKFVFFDASGPMAFVMGNVNTYPGLGFESAILEEYKQVNVLEYGSVIKFLGQHILSDPLGFLQLYFRKIFYFLNDIEAPANISIYLYREHSGMLPYLINHFAIFSSLGLIGIVLAIKNRKPVFLLTGFILALSVSVVLFHVVTRFRLPLTPFMIIFAAYTVHVWFEQIQLRQFKQMAVITLTAGALLVFTLDSRGAKPVRFVDSCNLAIAYLNHERLFDLEKLEDHAVQCWNAERAFAPNHLQSKELLSTAYNFYGFYLIRQGKYSKAETALKRSYSISTNLTEPYRLLADLAFKQNQVGKSIRWLQIGLSVNSRDVPLLKQLVQIYHQNNYAPARIRVVMQAWQALEKDPAMAESLKQELKSLQAAVEPSSPSMLVKIEAGRAHFLAGDWPQALDQYHKTNRSNQTEPGRFLEQGLAYGNLQQYEKALSSFYNGLMIQPDHAKLHKVLAEYYLSIQESTLAVIHLSRFLEVAENESTTERDRQNLHALRQNLANRQLEKIIGPLNSSEKQEIFKLFQASLG